MTAPAADGHDERARRIAVTVRDAGARLLERAYEEAAMQGLCGEGALEYARDRLRHADPDELLAGGDAESGGG